MTGVAVSESPGPCVCVAGVADVAGAAAASAGVSRGGGCWDRVAGSALPYAAPSMYGSAVRRRIDGPVGAAPCRYWPPHYSHTVARQYQATRRCGPMYEAPTDKVSLSHHRTDPCAGLTTWGEVRVIALRSEPPAPARRSRGVWCWTLLVSPGHVACHLSLSTFSRPQTDSRSTQRALRGAESPDRRTGWRRVHYRLTRRKLSTAVRAAAHAIGLLILVR